MAIGSFALFNLALLVVALRMGGAEVRDGAGTVTTGANVALAIGVTLAAAYATRWLRMPARLRDALQLYALVAQAAHAGGHLMRWYYDHRWYDDALHVSLVLGAAILLVRLAQAWNVFPASHATPLRCALVALVGSLAIAAAWEIFEFTADTLQSTREQDDLQDTMRDMVDGAVGGVAAAAYLARSPKPHVRRGRREPRRPRQRRARSPGGRAPGRRERPRRERSGGERPARQGPAARSRKRGPQE